jgi:hypothetical protein
MMMIVKQLAECMSGGGNQSTRRKPASVPLSTTDPTRPDPGSNPGRRSGKKGLTAGGTARPSHPNCSYGLQNNLYLKGFAVYKDGTVSKIPHRL